MKRSRSNRLTPCCTAISGSECAACCLPLSPEPSFLRNATPGGNLRATVTLSQRQRSTWAVAALVSPWVLIVAAAGAHIWPCTGGRPAYLALAAGSNLLARAATIRRQISRRKRAQ